MNTNWMDALRFIFSKVLEGHKHVRNTFISNIFQCFHAHLFTFQIFAFQIRHERDKLCLLLRIDYIVEMM